MRIQNFGSDDAQSGISPPPRASVEFIFSTIFVSIGFIVIQSKYIDLFDFFTPAHHDDFNIIYGSTGLFMQYPRPVSSALMYNLGTLGNGFYYIMYFLVWMTCISLAQIYSFRVIGLKPRGFELGLASLFTSMSWFSLSSSVGSMQYIGQSTNAFSFLFAILAALFIAVDSRFSRKAIEYPIFFFITLLSAFSKEDMIFMLLGACLISGSLDRLKGLPLKMAVKRSALLMALVVVAFFASVLHSRYVGSPFTGGIGPYDISKPLLNAATNSIFYITLSRGTEIVFLTVFVVLIMSAYVFVAKKDQTGARSCLLLLAYAGPILPYLVLPRNFDYYATSFMPLLLSAIFPLTLSALFSNRERLPIAVVTAACFVLILNTVDHDLRVRGLDWYAMERHASRMQISELESAKDNGLRDCSRVVVSGVSSTFGPFLATSSEAVDRIVDRKIQWRISTEPNSMLESFATARPSADPFWQYVSAREARNLKDGYCKLSFSPSFRSVLDHGDVAAK